MHEANVAQLHPDFHNAVLQCNFVHHLVSYGPLDLLGPFLIQPLSFLEAHFYFLGVDILFEFDCCALAAICGLYAMNQ